MTWRPADQSEPSVFSPEHLLREARRQKGLPDGRVPEVCALDPDGDLVNFLRRSGRARAWPEWACYHTDLVAFDLADGTTAGVVGCAVGAPFAVLIAEQLFASGCQLLVSITSAGQIAMLEALPCVVLIDRALRDEGTSVHYLPPTTDVFVTAPNDSLITRVEVAVREALTMSAARRTPLYRGATWTTDAPYRETETAIVAARSRGVLAVEMEAAALYAFATLKRVPVVCFAHVTNTMGQRDGNEFEKGEEDGSVTALRVITATARAYGSWAHVAV